MMLLGMDVNASRARAVSGPMGDFPCPVPLDPPTLELALVLSLEKPTPDVGARGLRLVRRLPHLAYKNFLANLNGTPVAERRWFSRKKKLDAGQALELVFRRLQPICSSCTGAVLALPCYLSPVQVERTLALAGQARLSLLGSLPSSLAAALAAYAEQAWFGFALVMDIDDHALSVSALHASQGQANLLETRSFSHLGLGIWKERLLNALADCCVWQSRRDPRASPQAEQALFEQLDGVMDACRQGRLIQLGLQADHWYQNLVVSPEQPASFCSSLVSQVLGEMESFLARPWPEGPPNVWLMTAAAGRLPGLVRALRTFLEDWSAGPCLRTAPVSAEDFGENLFHDGPGGSTTVLVLSADAAARGAHTLAASFQHGDLVLGHLARGAPLPLPQPVEAGPARLHFQGEDYFINEARFSLGRQHGCNLVFDGEVYQGVSPRHCEIIFDHRTFMLIDRSREGTLLNDGPVTGSVLLRAGDWIRLGPDGPLLRFLGQNPHFKTLMTTA